MSDRDGSIILDSVIPFMWKLGSVVAGIVAVAAGFLYVKQDSLLYFPGECVLSEGELLPLP
jgi:hypothetical protein